MSSPTSFWDPINDVLFWICLYFLLWNAYILLFNRGAPNIKTARPIRSKIIELLKDDYARKKSAGKIDPDTNPYVIIDPGCGNGTFSREMARALPEARIIGIEISRIAYWRCLLGLKLSGLKNLEYTRSDFFDFDMSIADAVIIFQHIYDMTALGEKLKQELKPDTLVTSNKFKLAAGWEPDEYIDISTIHPNQKTLHLYRNPPRTGAD